MSEAAAACSGFCPRAPGRNRAISAFPGRSVRARAAGSIPRCSGRAAPAAPRSRRQGAALSRRWRPRARARARRERSGGGRACNPSLHVSETFQLTWFILSLNYQATTEHTQLSSVLFYIPNCSLWGLFLLEIHYTNAAGKTIGRVKVILCPSLRASFRLTKTFMTRKSKPLLFQQCHAVWLSLAELK